MKKAKYLSLVALVLLILAVLTLFLSSKYRIVSISGKKFVARTAVTPEQQRKGLGDRPNLCSNCAMLFIFQQEGHHSFWMKHMNFNLDILWIAKDRVIYIAKNVSHDAEDILNPEVEADKVIEINASLSDRHGFKIGDIVKIY